MNKLKLRLAACAVMLLASVGAHAASVILGYCEGALGTTGYSKTGKGTISAAFLLSKEMLAEYDGATITAVRIGLMTTDGISQLRGWVKYGLEEAVLDSVAVDAPAEGWNEGRLSTGITIDASRDIYVGYSFYQEKSVKCISVAGPDRSDGYFVAKNGSWQNRSKDAEGTLCAEIVVEGPNIPAKDLRLLSVEPIGTNVVAPGETISVRCIAQNAAQESIKGFKYTYQLADGEPTTVSINRTLDYRDRDTLVVEVPTEGWGAVVGREFTVSATTDGDQQTDNNTLALRLSTYTESYQRKVLLEEFTTENCPNCPRAIETIATVLANGYEDKTVAVAHHSGYKYDWLTTDADETLEWFYGEPEDGTFAPAGMFDRTQNDLFRAKVPVFSIAYPDTYQPMLDVALSVPTFVTVEPHAAYDEVTRQLRVSVDTKKMDVMDEICPASRIALYLIEDSILAKSQAGYSSTTFRHSHVFRQSLSDVYGDLIAWSGNSATIDFTATLPSDWDASQVKVVAFVCEYDSTNRNACRVFNSEQLSLSDVVAGIETTSSHRTAKSVSLYDLSGRKVDADSFRGIAIRRTVLSDGTVSTEKTLIGR